MTGELGTAAWYPIGAVARKTGVSVHTLRAWERRYSAVNPKRSAGGTRLYSNADIVRLRLLRRATEAGHPIGQVADRTIESLRQLLREDPPSPVAEEEVRGKSRGRGSRQLVEEIVRAVELMDGDRIHALLMRAVIGLSVGEVVEEVLLPVLRNVGELWAAGSICPANEHLLSVNVRRVLAWMTDAVPVSSGAPTMVATTPAGQWHELGVQMAGVLAAEAGWRVVFLGANLPARDILRAVEITGARVVSLGLTMTDGEPLMRELNELRDGLSPDVRVIVGGRGAEAFAEELEAIGMTYLPSHRGFVPLLEESVGEPGMPNA